MNTQDFTASLRPHTTVPHIHHKPICSISDAVVQLKKYFLAVFAEQKMRQCVTKYKSGFTPSSLASCTI